MAENKININSNKQLKENDIMNMIEYNNKEEFINARSKTIKPGNMENIKFLKNYSIIKENEIDDYIPLNKLKRCNSVDIYKKRIREKKLKNLQNNNNLNENENDDIKNSKTNDKNNIIDKNGKKIKRVTFRNSTLVTIIDVESYKKYNQPNTSNEPFVRVINNNINIKKSINMNLNKNNDINNNVNDNKNNKMNNYSDNKTEKKPQSEKENVVCSCSIF